MMKRSIAPVSFALALALAGGASAQTMGVGANPQGSLYHRISVAVAKLMNEKMGVKARVQPFSGSSTYIPLLNRDELQLALINVSDAGNSMRGDNNFEGRPQKNIRLLNIMFPLPFTLLVPADSPIKKISDVKGLRMPSDFTGQTTIRTLQRAILANAGLSAGDVKRYPVPNVFKGAQALGEGKVDAAGIGPGVTSVQKAHLKLKRRGGVRFVSIDTSPAALAAMKKVVISKPMVVKPAKHLPGIVEPTTFMAFLAFMATNTKMTDQAAYTLVKLIHDNKPHLVKSTKALLRFNPKGMSFDFGVPYHPGAIKFYREIGQWPAPKG
jgi:TRAP transporter TAXI family solute receptor